MNTKPEFEVWSELRQHLVMIESLQRANVAQKIHAAIQDVHVVEMIELKNYLKKIANDHCLCGQCGKVIVGREDNRYVIVYNPTPNATIRIYSNPIILN